MQPYLEQNRSNRVKIAGIRLNGEPFMLPSQIQQKETIQITTPKKLANQLSDLIKKTSKNTCNPCIRTACDDRTVYLSRLSLNNCVLSVSSVGVYLWLNSKSNSYYIDHQYINSFSSFMTEVVWKEILQAEKNLHFLKDQPKIAASRDNTILKIEELKQQAKTGFRQHIEEYFTEHPQLKDKRNTYISALINNSSMLELIPIINQIDVETLLQEPAEVEALNHEIELLQQRIATWEVQAFCQYCLSPQILALFDSLREIWPVEDETTYCAAIRSFAAQAKVELNPTA